MLYVKMKNGLPIEVRFEYPHDVVGEAWADWRTRWDWKSYEEVCGLARYITAMTGRSFIGTDAGSSVSPQFDIQEIPKVGDPVSYTFNGDYYPDGYITKITKTLQVHTSGGNRYIRRKKSGHWVMAGGTWSLIKGHKSEMNPSF